MKAKTKKPAAAAIDVAIDALGAELEQERAISREAQQTVQRAAARATAGINELDLAVTFFKDRAINLAMELSERDALRNQVASLECDVATLKEANRSLEAQLEAVNTPGGKS